MIFSQSLILPLVKQDFLKKLLHTVNIIRQIIYLYMQQEDFKIEINKPVSDSIFKLPTRPQVYFISSYS